jgi:hypothetical protein
LIVASPILTFEHVDNTPNAQYTFTNASSITATQPADGPGTWVFSSTGAAGAPTPSGNMLGIPPGSDGFTGGLSHIWAPILPLFP